MEKGCSRDASRFDNRHQIIFVLPRRDFGAIIMDKESSSAYKNQKTLH